MKLEFVKCIDINSIAKAGIVLAVVIAEALKPDKDYITRRREERIKKESERLRNESIRNERLMKSIFNIHAYEAEKERVDSINDGKIPKSFFDAYSNTTSEEEIVYGIKNAAIKETSDYYKYEKAKKIRDIIRKNPDNDRIKATCIRALFEIANACKDGGYYKRQIEDMTFNDDITWFSF